MARYHTLRLVLGDQLNSQHSWFDDPDPQTLYVVAEMRQETDYVKHHIQKLCGFFAAMARFAEHLREQGHQVLHLTLDDTSQWPALATMIGHLIDQYQAEVFEYQRPDEYRLLNQLRNLSLTDDTACNEQDTEHFLVPMDDLKSYFSPGKHARMESFYRRMRRRFDILMQGDQPEGERWNFDADNRARLKPQDIEAVPAPLLFANNVEAILSRLEKHKVESFGKPMAQLPWPVDRQQALELLTFFLHHCLPDFGRFQDAMTGEGDHQWSLYHSRLSFALNAKILSPLEVIDAAVQRYQDGSDDVDIAQVEGFVRQILGWREYIRGIYWVNMPEYAEQNSLQAKRKLPEFFWTGDTRMLCLKKAIGQSLEFAYAHHIQRLMVTGNFCLLAGIDPDQVDAWYLGIYMDALEWVEMPNTRGMSQYADGGLVATKPYAASGNYTHKMSDYCKSCFYKVKEKTGERACPLNSLYWHFMTRHRETLSGNHRIGMIYRNWDKMTEENRDAITAHAEQILTNLDEL